MACLLHCLLGSDRLEVCRSLRSAEQYWLADWPAVVLEVARTPCALFAIRFANANRWRARGTDAEINAAAVDLL
jgi:hypothetical protein